MSIIDLDLQQAKALVPLNKTAAGRARDLDVINTVAGQRVAQFCT